MFYTFNDQLRKYLAEGQFRKQVLHGGVWLGAGTVFAQLFRFCRNILLARILAPDVFGAMAIIISVSSMIDTFSEIGIREAVIQSPNGHRRDYLNSALWFSAVRATVSYAVVYALAPFIARMYRNPELADLARLALAGVIFRGVMSPAAFAALKRMEYRRWTILQYGSSMAGTVITVVLALAMRDVRALALGFALEFVILAAASYVLFPFKPQLRIRRHSARELLKFSKGVFGLAFLNLIYLRADILVLGKLISQEQLGIYAIAIYLAQIPSTFVLNYQAQILMPVFSQLQNQFSRVNSILAKGVFWLSLLAVPACVFVALSGRTFLALLYGKQYMSGFWPFFIAVLIAFVNIANAQITTAFYAFGKPHLHRLCLLIMAALMLALVYPAAHLLGTAGTQLAALLAISVGYAIQLWQIKRLTGFRVYANKLSMLRLAGPVLILIVAIVLRGWVTFSGPATNLLLGTIAALLALAAAVLPVLGLNRNLWRAAAAN